MSDTPSYVPAGGQVLTPYICPRDAGEAIAWYVEVLGAVETGERFVDTDGRVGHAELAIGGATEAQEAARKFSETGAERGPVEAP